MIAYLQGKDVTVDVPDDIGDKELGDLSKGFGSHVPEAGPPAAPAPASPAKVEPANAEPAKADPAKAGWIPHFYESYIKPALGALGPLGLAGQVAENVPSPLADTAVAAGESALLNLPPTAGPAALPGELTSTPEARAFSGRAIDAFTFGLTKPVLDPMLADEYKDHPVYATAGQITGDLGSLLAVGGALKVAGLAGEATELGAKAAKYVASAPRFLPRAIMTGATFGTKTFVDKTIKAFQDGGVDPAEFGRAVLLQSLGGAAFGGIGGIAKMPLAVASAAGVMFTMSKMEGGSNAEAGLSATVGAAFEMVGSFGRSEALNREAIDTVADSISNYAKKMDPGLNPDMADAIGKGIVEREAAKVGGVDAIVKGETGKENTLELIEEINQQIRQGKIRAPMQDATAQAKIETGAESASPASAGPVSPASPPALEPGTPGESAPAPGTPSQERAISPSTESTLPAPAETGPVREGSLHTVFAPTRVSSQPSIAEHPDFIKMTHDANAVAQHYAEQRGVVPDAKFGKSLWQEMHDALGEIGEAPMADRMKVRAAIIAKYPDIEKEFLTLRDKVWSDTTDGYFNSSVAKKYGHLRPKLGIEAEDAFLRGTPRAVPEQPVSPTENAPKKALKFDAQGLPIRKPGSVVSKVQLADGQVAKITHQMILDEAESLHSQALEARGSAGALEKFVMDSGKIRNFKADEAGNVPEAEEMRSVPVRFQGGQHTPDEMAQMAFDRGLLPEPSADLLRAELEAIHVRGESPKLANFYDEAQRNLERMFDGGDEALPSWVTEDQGGTDEIAAEPRMSYGAELARQRQTEGLQAAVKDPKTGELYTGPSHADIMEQAFKIDPALGDRISNEVLSYTENVGFADENLEFVTRKNAERRFGILNSASLSEPGASYGEPTPLQKAITEYKRDPTIGDREKVPAIKKLLDTPQGKAVTQASQDVLKQIADKHDMVTIFRGGQTDVSTKADAGWTTELSVAIEFAADHNDGEIVVAQVPRADVLYHDSVISAQTRGGIPDEGEVVLKDINSAKVLKSYTPPTMPEEKSKSDLGYAHDDYYKAVENALGKYENPALKKGLIAAQPAYHGSPYKFDKFELQKIGTGEGNQAYGWGLYFAGKQDVADYYKRTLTSSQPLQGIGSLTPEEVKAIPNWMQNSLALAFDNGDNEQAVAVARMHLTDFLKRLADEREFLPTSQQPWIAQERIQNLQRITTALEKAIAANDLTPDRAGRLYTVDIPEDNEFLDHDKIIADQKDVLKNVGKFKGDKFIATIENIKNPSQSFKEEFDPYSESGSTLYNIIADRMADHGWVDRAGSDEMASRYLASKGIPGLKYLDQLSRGTGSGSSNYVLFDDSKVKTLSAQEPAGSPYQQELNFSKPAQTGTPAEHTVAGGFKAIMQPHLESEFKKVGAVMIPNREIQSPADIAYAFKQLHNEAQENFFLGAVKNNRIVAVEHLGFGTVAQIAVYPFETINLIDKNDADGFFIVHNHPTGEVVPSKEDKQLTNTIKSLMAKNGVEFKGHVIIDDIKFGFIDPNGNVTTETHQEYSEKQELPILRKHFDWQRSKESIAEGPSIQSPSQVFELMKGIQKDPTDGLICLLDIQNRILNAVVLPRGKFNAGTIQRLAAAYRASGAITVNSGLDDMGYRNLKADLRVLASDPERGFLLDDVSYAPDKSGGSYESKMERLGENKAEYGSDMFPESQENVAARYERLKKQARDQGMGPGQAAKWAKANLTSKPSLPTEPRAQQTELGDAGGVQGFGQGRQGEGELNLSEKGADYGAPNPAERYEKLKEEGIARGMKRGEAAKWAKEQILKDNAEPTVFPAAPEEKIATLNDTVESIKEVGSEIRDLLVPTKSAPHAAEILRENLAKMARSYDKAETALEKASNLFDTYTPKQLTDFIDKMEHGEAQASPALDTIAAALRKLLDLKRQQVQDLGTGKLESFIENYFPHIWDQSERTASKATMKAAKRPLEGSKAFLKKRTIEFFKDGIKLGLTPVSYNPVELTLLKMREMDKYIAAHQTLNALKEEGLAKFVRVGGEIPEGWTKIDDKISTVMVKSDMGMTIVGHYYTQEDAARLINNYLKPGLQKFATFRAYRYAGNLLNQFQLGFSAFHLGFTSMDSIVSKMALAVNQLALGHPLRAIGDALQAPIAPIQNMLRGDKVLKAWMGTGTGLDEVMANAMESAGGRARMDQFYATKAWDQMKKYFSMGAPIRGLLHVPLALTELSSKPILEYIVPRQKLGIFADIMRMEMEHNPNMTHDEMRTIAQRAWDSVDNRMGQLVYDNLFWNKAFKDLLMGSVRSVGWNLGTIRELAGGVYDIKQIGQEKGRGINLSYRAAYLIALPIVVGIAGAIYQYLRTGKGPENLKDYFYPRTGGIDKNGMPARVSFPSYMKDIYHYSQAPIQTILNKLNPVLSLIDQTYTNKDFYGVKMRNEDDPIIRQLMSEAAAYLRFAEPFGLRNMQENIKAGNKSLSDIVEPWIGITPAPYDINQTDAEKMAHHISAEKASIGGRTQEQADHTKLMRELSRNFQAKLPEAETAMMDAFRNGKISTNDLTDLIRTSRMTPIQRLTHNFSADELARVIKVATPEEAAQLEHTMRIKDIRHKSKFVPQNSK